MKKQKLTYEKARVSAKARASASTGRAFPACTRRSRRGSMLILVVCCLGLLVMLIITLLNFAMLVSHYHSTNNVTDGQVLEFAKQLNEENKLGDLLDLTRCAREGVFSARMDCQKTSYPRFKLFAPLADMLMVDVREGAHLIEQEHRRQIEASLADLRNSVSEYNNIKRSKSQFDSVILQREGARITDVEVGFCKSTPSSIQHSNGVLRELDLYDIQATNCDAKSGYFKPQANAKLPYDDDLQFTLDSLAPVVDNDVSPARLMHERSFVSYGKIFNNGIYHHKNLDMVPSAIRITQALKVKGLNGNDKAEVSVSSIATGAGAHAPIWSRAERPIVVSGIFVDPGEPGQDWKSELDLKPTSSLIASGHAVKRTN